MKQSLFLMLCLLALTACNQNSDSTDSIYSLASCNWETDTVDSSSTDDLFTELVIKKKKHKKRRSCLNSVIGHDEKDIIVGNFTGHGLDTLFVVQSQPDTTKDWELSISYYAISNNKKIPPIQLYGHVKFAPRIVFEGDLDGNGTDEWGYLHTWLNSQWRYYRVFTLVRGEWRYLVESDKLDTPEWFRCSGQDIIEPAGKPGYVKIHYGTFGRDFGSYDTIEKVTFSKITD